MTVAVGGMGHTMFAGEKRNQIFKWLGLGEGFVEDSHAEASGTGNGPRICINIGIPDKTF